MVTTVADVVDPQDGLTSLREAITYANTHSGDDTITFDPSLSAGGPATITLGGSELALTDTTGVTTVTGPGASRLTISGNQASRVFNIATEVVADISGLTITKGLAVTGGGIFDAGKLTIRECIITQNASTGGFYTMGSGGVYVERGTLTVIDSAITGNTGSAGVAVGAISGATVVISGSVLSNNNATNGGAGLYLYQSTGTVTDTTLSGNTAAGASSISGGGAIKNDERSHLTLDRVTLSGNSTAGYGGGVYTYNSETVATNSTIVANTAGTRGAGFATVGSSSTMTLTNCTVADNVVTNGAGAGISVDGQGALPAIKNTILARNTAASGPNVAGAVGSLGHNLIDNVSGSSGWLSSDLVGVDPLLGPLGDYGGPTQTMSLLPGSPAINAGDNSGAPTSDQRGFPRLGAVDIGAYEYAAFSLTPAALPAATLNIAYIQTISALGATGATTLTVTNIVGAIAGLTIPTSGVDSITISGTPSALGTVSFTVTALDSAGHTASRGYSIAVGAPVTLSPATLPQDTVNVGYYETITASGGTGTLRLSVSNVTGAIPGLTLPTSGAGSLVISGTPTSPGTETFTVTATGSQGGIASASYSITVNPAPRLTPATLPADAVGVPYLQTITASGGTGPLTLMVRTILEPIPGLVVPTIGSGSLVISGTPTAPGTETFVVTAIDSLGATGSATYGITVNPAIVLSPATLAADTVNVPYSQTILASGGTGTVRLAVSNAQGTIPGLTLPTSGTGTLLIGGTPTATGTESFTVTATDSAGNIARSNYSIIVNPAVRLSPATLPAGAENKAYLQTIAAAGGTGTVTLAVSNVQGTIPGLIMPNSATGSLVIGGTPTAAGTETFTVTATDAVGGTARANYRITVNPALALSPAALPADTVGVAYRQTITASGGASDVLGSSVTLVVSNLQGEIPGLNVPNSGAGSLAISGTPTAAGTETFTVTATDSAGGTVSANYSITVNPAVSLSPSTLPPDVVSVAYNQIITAAGGTGTVALAVSNVQGAIPGLVVPGSGTGSLAITGTPTATGIETFTVTATDSVGGTAVANYSIRVTPAVSIAIADASVLEGNSGTVNMGFDVTLSAASAEPVSVKYATADGTAQSASDYIGTSGTLVFNPGETGKRILVAVNGDTILEPNETFLLNLSNPLGATLADGQAVGTILNDDTTAPQAVPYTQNFAAGLPNGSLGWEYFSTAEGRIAVVNGQLRMDDKVNNSVYSLNEAILHVNLAGRTGAQLKLDHISSGDEKNTYAGSQFTGHVNADLIALSVDGAHWVKVTDLSTNFTQKTFALDTLLATAARAAAGSSDRFDVRIKLQQYDNQPWNLDGRAFDNIALTAALSPLASPTTRSLAGAAVGTASTLQTKALAADRAQLIDAALAQWASEGVFQHSAAEATTRKTIAGIES